MPSETHAILDDLPAIIAAIIARLESLEKKGANALSAAEADVKASLAALESATGTKP